MTVALVVKGSFLEICLEDCKTYLTVQSVKFKDRNDSNLT